jgi:branched-subunit amino acid transport protein
VNLWLALLVGGLLTYLLRLSFIAFSGREFPAWLERSLRFVPPAVLTAILFPELFIQSGSLDISLGNNRLLAGLVAILVAWRTRSMLLTILAGMGALLLLQWLR